MSNIHSNLGTFDPNKYKNNGTGDRPSQRMAGDYLSEFTKSIDNNKPVEKKPPTYVGNNGNSYKTNTEKMLFGNTNSTSNEESSSAKPINSGKSKPVNNGKSSAGTDYSGYDWDMMANDAQSIYNKDYGDEVSLDEYKASLKRNHNDYLEAKKSWDNYKGEKDHMTAINNLYAEGQGGNDDAHRALSSQMNKVNSWRNKVESYEQNYDAYKIDPTTGKALGVQPGAKGTWANSLNEARGVKVR